MKIAVALSGHVRNYKLFGSFFKKLNWDIYFATWDVTDVGRTEKVTDEIVVSTYAPKKYKIYNYELYQKAFKEKYEYISKYRKYEAEWHKGRLGHDSYSMFFLMKESMGLVENQYDIIVRTRPDGLFYGSPTIQPKQNEIIYPANANHNKKTTDLLFYGNYDSMRKFSNLYDWMDIYLLKENCEWVNEKICDHHLNKLKMSHRKDPSLYQNISSARTELIA